MAPIGDPLTPPWVTGSKISGEFPLFYGEDPTEPARACSEMRESKKAKMAVAAQVTPSESCCEACLDVVGSVVVLRCGSC